MGERRERDPLWPPQPFTSPASPRGPRLPEPSRIYHGRTWGGFLSASRYPAPAPGGGAARVRHDFRVLPTSVLQTNCPSTATPRLPSGAGVPRLGQPAPRLLGDLLCRASLRSRSDPAGVLGQSSRKCAGEVGGPVKRGHQRSGSGARPRERAAVGSGGSIRLGKGRGPEGRRRKKPCLKSPNPEDPCTLPWGSPRILWGLCVQSNSLSVPRITV
ncbi:uncharacterized protein LOC131827820 [Mustela lutreola]|uniref:uncharacterized protein LOC131827820 n=1 Tax=Mustela lutreola TaxID=9666 RepID=UPI00279762EE|nr:uncharacterized protein LOC131827820 [Mustela lutreola]